MSIIKASDLTRRVALYQSQYGSLMLSECGKDPDKFPLDGWVRVSEVLEITCTPLSQGAIAAGRLAALYQLRATTEKEFAAKLENIDASIANLRALPAPAKT